MQPPTQESLLIHENTKLREMVLSYDDLVYRILDQVEHRPESYWKRILGLKTKIQLLEPEKAGAWSHQVIPDESERRIMELEDQLRERDQQMEVFKSQMETRGDLATRTSGDPQEYNSERENASLPQHDAIIQTFETKLKDKDAAIRKLGESLSTNCRLVLKLRAENEKRMDDLEAVRGRVGESEASLARMRGEYRELEVDFDDLAADFEKLAEQAQHTEVHRVRRGKKTTGKKYFLRYLRR